MHPGVVAVIVTVVLGLLLMVILMPLSFHRVNFDEVAVSYDKVSRELGTKILREGLHDLGPSGSLIVLKTTQRTASAENLKALTNDGMLVNLDIQVSYTIKIDEVFAIIDEFTDQEGHDRFLDALCESVIRDTSVKFSARAFYLQREDFQTALLNDITTAFSTYNVHATPNIVQVVNIDLPNSVESALHNTTVSQQDVQNALTERAQDVQEAQIRLNLTKQQSDLLLLDADRQVAQINQQTEQAVLTQRNRILQRTYAFGNISVGLGMGGNFFVNTYLKALVTQMNTGKTIVGI
jgi:regulator of protease activity HflC (stomatin/prohibitin superfamily)